MKSLIAAVLASALFALPAIASAAPHSEVDILSGKTILRCSSTSYGAKKVVLVCVAGTMKRAANGTAYATTPFGPYEFHPYAEFVDAPLGNGAPAVGCADTTITCTGGYNVALNTANANTWSAAQTFSGGLTGSGANTFSGQVQNAAAAALCPGSGTAIGSTSALASEYAPACMGPITGVNALVIGKTTGSGWGGTTASDSGAIDLCYNTGSADRCAYLYYSNATGALVISGTSAVMLKVGGNIDLALSDIRREVREGAGSTACTGTGTFTGAANTSSTTCVVTASSGAAQWTFATAWGTTPSCVVSDRTTAGGAKVTAVSTSSVSISMTGASDVVDVRCTGNGGT